MISHKSFMFQLLGFTYFITFILMSMIGVGDFFDTLVGSGFFLIVGVVTFGLFSLPLGLFFQKIAGKFEKKDTFIIFYICVGLVFTIDIIVGIAIKELGLESSVLLESVASLLIMIPLLFVVIKKFFAKAAP